MAQERTLRREREEKADWLLCAAGNEAFRVWKRERGKVNK